METLPVAEARLQSEIDALRAQHPETQDLYREVCVLLFFRYGMTPTANKLYQLVRKGSMSAPAEALARFWETLREKSRIRIEHPDLPEPLRDAAGEMLGALWQHAQAAAQDALEHFREDSRAQVLTAEGVAQAAVTNAEETHRALILAREELLGLQQRLTAAQADFARAQGEVTALQRQVEAGAEQRRELQGALNTSHQRFTQELEQQRAATALAVERHNTEARRLLLDVDRERGNSAKLQKELDLARRVNADQADLNRQQLSGKQQQMDELRQRNGELEGSVGELRGQRDQLLQEVGGLRQRLEIMSVAHAELEHQVKQAADAAKPSKPKRARSRAQDGG